MPTSSFALDRFGNVKEIYWNVLLSGVSAFTNCFASPSLLCKGGNKILFLWTTGVFLTLCDPGESFHVLASFFSNNVVHQPCCPTTIKNIFYFRICGALLEHGTSFSKSVWSSSDDVAKRAWHELPCVKGRWGIGRSGLWLTDAIDEGIFV